MAERVLGAPVLAQIPHLQMRSGGLVSVEGSSARAQSLRRLRENVLELGRNGGLGSFAVCSAGAKSGKAITVAGLAIGLAEAGASVVALDADTGGLSLAKALGAPVPGAGLAEVLAGRATAEAVAAELDAPPGHLFLLRPGETGLPPDSLGGSTSRRLFEHLAGRFDYVLTNVPPLLDQADAIDLARLAGAVLLVLRNDAVSRREAEDVRALLERAALEIRGVVLTDSGETPDGSIRPAELRGRLLSRVGESRSRDVERAADLERQAASFSEREAALAAAEAEAADRTRLLAEQEARLASAAEADRTRAEALARREQEPAEERDGREAVRAGAQVPEPARDLPLPRVGRWRLATLEEVTGELAAVDPARAEELGFYLEGLRQVVGPDGVLPGSVDGLVLETFAGLLPQPPT